MVTAPTLIFIIGPQAVGKMTVGQELSRATGYKFMSNHQTIELLLPIFDYGSPSFRRLLFDFRVSIFEEFAASERPGLIFSCVSDFDSALDRGQTECYAAPFLRVGGRVLFVELESSLETRLERNRTPNRQQHKPSKRDVAFSEKLLREEEGFRTDWESAFPYAYPHLKINNEALAPQQVVAEICAYFGLEGGENRLRPSNSRRTRRCVRPLAPHVKRRKRRKPRPWQRLKPLHGLPGKRDGLHRFRW